jgi:hypothetical protein
MARSRALLAGVHAVRDDVRALEGLAVERMRGDVLRPFEDSVRDALAWLRSLP